jgi:hypothetical protein
MFLYAAIEAKKQRDSTRTEPWTRQRMSKRESNTDLPERWAAWFEGLTITLEENGDTCLTGPVIDQAALHGLLRKVRDLGIPLISILSITPGQADRPHDQP